MNQEIPIWIHIWTKELLWNELWTWKDSFYSLRRPSKIWDQSILGLLQSQSYKRMRPRSKNSVMDLKPDFISNFYSHSNEVFPGGILTMLIALLRSPNGNGISDAVKRLKASYPDWRPPFSNEDGFLQIFWPELPEVVRGIPYNDHRRQELFIELFMALRQKKIFGYVFLISSPPTYLLSMPFKFMVWQIEVRFRAAWKYGKTSLI